MDRSAVKRKRVIDVLLKPRQRSQRDFTVVGPRGLYVSRRAISSRARALCCQTAQNRRYTAPGPPIVPSAASARAHIYAYISSRSGILFRRVSRPPATAYVYFMYIYIVHTYRGTHIILYILYNAFTAFALAYHAYLTFPGAR